MNESLEKTGQGIQIAGVTLHDALNKSNNVQGIIILELLRQANELHRDIEAFHNAYEADAREV